MKSFLNFFGKKIELCENDVYRLACIDILNIARKGGSFVKKADKVIHFTTSNETKDYILEKKVVGTYEGKNIVLHYNDEVVYISFEEDTFFQLVFTTPKNFEMHCNKWKNCRLIYQK